jgi:repressor LexA
MHHALCSEKEVILKKIIKTKQRILKAIQDFMEDHGYPPSIREIAKKVGLKSTKAVKVHLDNLAKQGLIDRIACQARSIRIKPKLIPIIGRVTAGLPELAFEEIEGYFNPSKWRGCFLLKVKGDSMINAHIYDGDMVVVKPGKGALNNDIIVALLEDETTVKRLKKIGSAFVLKPENDAYSVIKRQFEIIGKVIGVIRKV